MIDKYSPEYKLFYLVDDFHGKYKYSMAYITGCLELRNTISATDYNGTIAVL